MIGAHVGVFRVVVVGVHHDGEGHLATARGARGLRDFKDGGLVALHGFAVHRRAVRGAVGEHQSHVVVRGVRAVRVERHADLRRAVLELERDYVRARPSRSQVLVRNPVAVANGDALVWSHFPGVAVLAVVPVVLFPVGVASKILVQQVLDFVGPFFHVEHGEPCTEFRDEPAHALVTEADIEPVGLEQVGCLAVGVAVHPAHRPRAEPCAHECGEYVAVLCSAQKRTLVLAGDALSAGAAEGAVDEPTRVAFDGHEGSNHRCRVQESHAAVDAFAVAEHVLLNPGVARFLEPVCLLCAGVAVCHRVDALVDHRVHLRHAIAVRAARVETVQRVERCRDGRVARDPCLPSASGVCLRAACARARAVVVHRAVLAVLRLCVRGPAHHVVEVAEVGVVFLEDTVDSHVGNAAVAILAPVEGPPLAGLFAGHARTVVVELGGRLDFAQVRLGVVIEVRAVGGPGVGIPFRCGGRSPHSRRERCRGNPSHTLFLHKYTPDLCCVRNRFMEHEILDFGTFAV